MNEMLTKLDEHPLAIWITAVILLYILKMISMVLPGFWVTIIWMLGLITVMILVGLRWT